MSCPFASYDYNISTCNLTQAGRTIQSVSLWVASTPTVVQLLRLSPFVIIIDEFSYYAYHTASYDRGFRFLV